MDRNKLASLLEDMALYMDLLGENTFKVRAHQNGARIVESTSDLEDYYKNETLGDLKGIGPGLQQKIKEFAQTGVIAEHSLLKNKVPEGLIELLSVPGLGPKKARVVFDKLGIKSVGELEYACRENRLVKLEGFGEKTQAKIFKSLEFLKKNQNTFLYSDAILEAQLLIAFIKSIKGVLRVEIVGALRRRLETVRGIGLLISVRDPGKSESQILETLKKYPGVVFNTGDEVSSQQIGFALESGIPVKIKLTAPDCFAADLLKLTGSASHVKQLGDFSLNNNIILKDFLETKGLNSEESIYEGLGLSYIPPELREGLDEIKSASSHSLPQLLERQEIKGIFHCHTTESDGSNTLEEMIEAAQNLGFEYIGISDHSASSAAYANGLMAERVLTQFSKIEALQKLFKIRIFKGIESDILADGSLDYEDEILRKFDFVIGSVHSGFSQKREQMTARVLKAISNPYLDFLGHPTGRLLLARDGYDIDMEAVITSASEKGVVVEINASPQRLDLDWRFGSFLKSKKGLVSINPDAHSVAGLEDVEFGVGVARKAGLSSDYVINTLPAAKILGRLRRSRADN